VRMPSGSTPAIRVGLDPRLHRNARHHPADGHEPGQPADPLRCCELGRAAELVCEHSKRSRRTFLTPPLWLRWLLVSDRLPGCQPVSGEHGQRVIGTHYPQAVPEQLLELDYRLLDLAGAPRVSSPGTASRRGGKSSAGGRSPVSILLITSCETVALAARSSWDRPARVR
jgi:hypothetical protein